MKTKKQKDQIRKTLKVDLQTKANLDKMLNDKETYDNLIDRLIDNYKNKKTNKFFNYYTAIILTILMLLMIIILI